MDRGVNRGDVWIAEVGRKRRPVVVLTRSEVIYERSLVTVAEVTTSVRGIAVEVEFDHEEAGIDRPSVVNCDGLYTIPKELLATRVGSLSDDSMEQVCEAVTYALSCW